MTRLLITAALALAAFPPDARRATPSASTFTDADYEAHIAALKKRLPRGATFNITIEKPFVVIGDEPLAAVKAHARGTVRFAVERLKRDFFTRDPDRIINVWLFKDKTSYNKYTKEYFKDSPDTPYGYYSTQHHALIMNIATGGGTLVHEIVHPYIRANFPACPPWFNEGLGSLYEQSNDRNGHIVGETNWRLDGLQKTLRWDDVPTFKTLCEMNDDKFYGDDRGTNYAQARYLLYYMQERGLLVKYYHAFVAAKATDPSGYETLKKTLGETDMAAFTKRWKKFVLGLTFP